MSVLIIGGDKIAPLAERLKTLGAQHTEHWDSRRNSTSHKQIPANTDCIIMLTDFLKHNSMSHFKKEAKKMKIPFICTRRGCGCIEQEFCSLLARRDA